MKGGDTLLAVYEKGPARPTGGCAAVAMLIGNGGGGGGGSGGDNRHDDHDHDNNNNNYSNAGNYRTLSPLVFCRLHLTASQVPARPSPSEASARATSSTCTTSTSQI